MRDFDSALERVVAGVQSRKTMTDHEKRVVAYHEAGHALCGELLPSVDRVHRISIVPRGRALGYTLNLPEEDRYLKSREELIDFMTMLLGGRAAEQLVFGSVTTGASDDLKRVAEIAHAMVHEYAMGTGSGSLRAVDDGAAEATRRMRDTEVRELADEASARAQTLLDAHRVQLDALASTLLTNEVLERADIDRIMGDVPRAAPAADRRAARSPRPPRSIRPRRPAVAGNRSLRRACCPPSTTSAWPSSRSTPRSRCTATPSACPSCTARPWTLRVSTRPCSTSATRTSSCSQPLSPDTDRGQVPGPPGTRPTPRRLSRGLDPGDPRARSARPASG